ncbi:MAG TPA: SDR family oxidoreductase, partial [Verrucomicrobiae bacterium]|nr:SDR family oxidoreductase [Verrucomicrobiae bacterium]
GDRIRAEESTMKYFVTGSTGFIGRFVVERLLARKNAQVYVLIRETSADKFEALKARFGEAGERLHAVWGDITTPGLITGENQGANGAGYNHVFHLAAVYDMNMDDETADRVNNEGTRNVVNFVNSLGDKTTLHHVSSVAVAGDDFVGSFTEDMFDEGQELKHPYYRTKFESERIVREECTAPWRVYRPGVVVGSSQTGEMDKVDGPYYFFKTIQKVRDRLPRWLPLLGVEGGRVPVVPVDYVADAMVAIAHQAGHDGKAFFLVQSDAPTVGELMRTLIRAAHGPDIARNFELPRVPEPMKQLASRLADRVPGNLAKRVSDAVGVPVSALGYITNRATFDDQNARAALKGTGIACPDIKDYAPLLWQYWELHLDTHVRVPRRAARRLQGKVILITGASSGIGLITAKKCAAAGAKVLLVARTREKLEETQRIIQKAGGEAHVYPCDLSNMESIDAMADQVLNDFGHVDVLVNNAGRSIRRAVMESLDRFHDYERTMQLNYFGCVRLILKLLPVMAKRRSGQIVNISSIGVLANAARFSAYVASKSALDAFSRCLSAEVKHKNIDITAIYMPLVRTPMIAPTKMYDYVPAWSPEKAGDTVLKAILDKPKSVATALGTAASISYALWPKINDFVLNKGFQLFPSSAAAKGAKDQKPTLEQVVFANVLRGEHW